MKSTGIQGQKRCLQPRNLVVEKPILDHTHSHSWVDLNSGLVRVILTFFQHQILVQQQLSVHFLAIRQEADRGQRALGTSAPARLILEEVFDTKCERKQWVKILKLDFKSIMTSIVHSFSLNVLIFKINLLLP